MQSYRNTNNTLLYEKCISFINFLHERLRRKKMGRKKCSCCFVSIVLVSALLILLGILIYLLFPFFIDSQVRNQVKLTNGSAAFDQWVNPPVPIYMQFWFFDIVNPNEVLLGEPPSVNQIGPYTYREHRLKFDIVFDTEKDLVGYRERKWFEFQPDMSVGNENDAFTTINLPVIVIATKLQSWPTSFAWLVDKIVKLFDKGLFRSYTVRDILWGYEDPLLKQAAALLKLVGIKLDDHVGLFYGKNNTDDGSYVVYTGLQTTSRVGNIYAWQNSSSLSFWSTKYANMINGTEGTTFPPFVKDSERLFVFSSDICRSIDFIFEKESSVLGINALRFTPPDNLFSNTTVNPDNNGYCIPNCLDSGVLNMSSCQPGIPAIMSQPHFYQAAEQYINGVVGLNPGPEFATLLDVESHTGVVLRAAKKLQINIDLRPHPGFTDTTKVRPVFLPIVWLNESAQLDDTLAAEFRAQLILPLTLAFYAQILLPALGVLGLLLCLAWCVRLRFTRQKTEDCLSIISHEPEDSHVQYNQQINSTVPDVVNA